MISRSRHECPCCGFPTLNDRGAFDICLVCWWEDDGQDDATADEIRGGPNSHYSLTAARRNFADHSHMYDAGEGIDAVEKPTAGRLKLLSYIEALCAGEPLDERHLDKLLRESRTWS